MRVPSLFVEFRIVTSLTPNLKGRDKLALRPSHQTQEAARLLGLQLVLLQATGEREIEEAVASLIQQGAAALIVSGDAMFYGRRAQIAELALKIPTSCPYRDQTAAGCLMSHGANVSETFRQTGNYVGRVLKGEKPADLPSTADQIRASHQSQDSEGARPRRANWTIGRYRRADRVGSFRCTAYVSLWHFAKIRRDDHKFGRYWRHSRLERAFSPNQLGRK